MESPQATQTHWRFPAGRVGFAVGDIHGRADLLARMFEYLEQRAEAERLSNPLVVFLGDYIDRGPDSAEVLELLTLGRPEGFERRFLKGNHEQAMLAFMDDPERARAWLHHGGMETLGSFGVRPPSLGAGREMLEETAQKLKQALSPKQLAFLRGLDRLAAQGDYLFVHAGVDPGRGLHEQLDGDLMWIRRPFLESKKLYSHCIVHGHTPVEKPYQDIRRIGVDTGAYWTGILSGVRLEGANVEFFSVSAGPDG